MGTVLHKDLTGADLHVPKAHKTSHHDGESDPVDHDLLLNFLANEHIDWTNAGVNFKTTGMGQLANIGIGTIPVSTQIIRAWKNMSGTSVVGVFGGPTNTLGTDSNQKTEGLVYTTVMAPFVSPPFNYPITVGDVAGCKVTAKLQGAGTHLAALTSPQAYGYKSQIFATKSSAGAVVITDGRHFWATNAVLTGGATLGIQRAFYDEGMTTGGINWGFYGLSARNYFAGKLGLGKTPVAKFDVAGAIASATLTFSTAGPTDNVNVSGINTLLLDCGSNAITIGGFAGGVDGQILYVALISTNNSVTIEHNEGGATQAILLHKGADETLAGELGGWCFVCHGGVDWHDLSHAKHV